MRAHALLAVLATACGTFEEPSIVLDLRVLAMRTDILEDNGIATGHADQVVEVDLMQPPAIGELVAQLRDTEVTAWVADPAANRELFWSMTLCLEDEEDRCDRTRPILPIGAAIIGDPDTSVQAQHPRAIIAMDDTRTRNAIIAMLLRALEDNPVTALGGVDLIVEMTIGGADEPREQDLYAVKKLKIAPRIPEGRAPNTNPRIANLESATSGGISQLPLQSSQRCASLGPNDFALTLQPGDSITLFPNEASDTREEYVVPGLNGDPIYLTETNTYQWLATYGGWSDDVTGGGHDILGNQSLLGSDWSAPNFGSETRVSIWMIQRDERFGVTPFETCITVIP